MDKHCKSLEFDKIINMLAENCVSQAAKQLAFETQPETSLDQAKDLLKKTDDAYKLIMSFSTPAFSGAKEIEGSLSRASGGGMLNNIELLEIGSLLKNIRSVKEWRSHSQGIETSIDYLFNSLYENKYLSNKIESSIKSEEEIYDNASDTLYAIRRKLSASANRIREKLDSMIHSATYQKYLQEPIVTQRNGRFVVPVKAEYRAQISGLVHDTSATGSTVFIEPMAVVEANNNIKILKSQEAEEIERILYELSSDVASCAETLTTAKQILVQLDLIFAKAKLAVKMNATMPELNDTGIINLKKARHPLLDKNSVVPVDVNLGTDYKTLVITGPNTGGKTVTIKTIGLVCVMASSGLMIPCGDHSIVAVFNHIFADIGDEQSIEQSLSTFSSHIKNIISIIDTVDNNSLVLLDELCSGTDPVEGAALATAILETLRKFGATVGATTHYAELKTYALDTEGVENACCEFDVASLAPTYRLLVGVPGRSNAFAISEKLGMDVGIINNAKQLVSAEKTRFERVVKDLETSRQELESKKDTAEAQLKQAQFIAQQAKNQAEKLRAEYNKEIEQAKAQARIITDNARIEANRLLDELEKIKKSNKVDMTKVNQLARKSFDKLDKNASKGELYKENYKLPRPLKIGDTVLMTDTDTKATVLALPDSKNKVLLQAGIMKMKVSIENIRLVEEKGINIPKSIYKKTRSGIDTKKSARSLMEIDVRGMTVDEAIMDIDKFIDEAMLNGMNSFTIIHGKGTGALRSGIQRYLKTNKQIRTFRLGLYGEGEDGVTIAELK